ncbi:alpha/beta hydrolase [Streptomyces sp. NBC_01381]|uniref:RBBP9/YdeN family alpha/beta hydrolase n=1 Tax=Streptomyces sp. NBC_01381 TaxID=2903845 RepID=UPI00225BAD11|nr:alpha/beta hydrolase [Streptomyces sp. NBC_01381]MCX4666898.1 alpha/beta hydrolase [Streptomyces sp. NBC_01381]
MTPTSVTPAPYSSFLILHGWQNHRPEGHWQRWLAGELGGRGARVSYPQLPDPDDPDLEVWLGRLQALLDGEQVVVCHSLGVLLWLHAVARGGGRVDRVLLVAPPSGDVLARYEEVAGFGGPEVSAAQVARAAGEVRLVAADDDPFCPGGAAARYGVPLGLDTDVVPGGGHLDLDAGYGAWPSVLEWCLDPGVRVSGRTD